MLADKVQLDPSWLAVLGAEFEAPYMQNLKSFLLAQKQARKSIYPKGKEIFAALDLCHFDQVRVVIIGQDPYHGAGQAHGLCFSVPVGVPPPPSAQNIFQEIDSDLGDTGRSMPKDRGCLEGWTRQGVLLLNAVLTVEHGRAASHQGRGWEQFTDRIVSALATDRDGLVFMLWGSYAQKKGAMVDRQRHCVLEAPHPSPLSAYRGFFGCRHFSRANSWLQAHGQPAIDWFVVT